MQTTLTRTPPFILRANEDIRHEGFFLDEGRRILLPILADDWYLPGEDRKRIPYGKWVSEGKLLIDGYGDMEMIKYNWTQINMFAPEEPIFLEPMFHHMLQSPLMGLVGVEIGVHLAENAEKILKALPMDKLYLIDSYDENPDYQFGNPDLKMAKEFARKRLEPYGDKVVWIYEKSVDALPNLHNLDFAYHDSDHRRPCVEAELPLGYAAVKPGGYWGGHDYKQTLEGMCEVKSCVDEYFLKMSFPELYYSSTMLNWWTMK